MEKRKKKRFFPRLILTMGIIFVAFALGVLIFVFVRYDTSVDTDMFNTEIIDSTTRFYCYESTAARNSGTGELIELEEILHGTRRILHTDYEDIPIDLINAFIAIEDRHFFTHRGVDMLRTAKAVANYALGFERRFGGSTITQQLIKNATGNNEVSVDRKIQELLYAVDLERKMTKEQILENYLNIINLSEGCYGVGAAADIYFSKSVSELTLAECATIAAITNSPTYYDPIRNPENNKERRDLILRAMLECEYISESEYAEASASEVVLNVNEKALDDGVNSWYVDMAVEDIIVDLCDKYGYSREEASNIVYNGGLRINLAMDPRVQEVLDDYYSDSSNFECYGVDTPQSSMIVIDPYSGDILGVAGAVGKKSGNRVQSYATDSRRPSGSVIKPLSVYAPALESGLITYASVFDDVPIKFNFSSSGRLISTWPQNANMVYRGLTNVNFALSNSLNTVAVKILEKYGVEKSFYFLKDTLGIESLIENREENGVHVTDKVSAALALGQMSYGVTLREVTSAYTMLTNKGVKCDARSYFEVYDSRGRLILSNPKRETQAISSANACVVTQMLKNVLKTKSTSVVKLDNMVDVAGKTGTTQNVCDKWFIGYTPYCLCGIWYGYEYPKPIGESQKYEYLDIWDDIMTELHEDVFIPEQGRKRFEMDENVITATFCRDSGKLMSSACYLDPRGNRAEVGYFVKGTEPRSYCKCHVCVDYDHEHGGVACPNCPQESVEKVGMITVERSFPDQIYVTDAQYVYRKIPEGTLPCVDPRLPFFANALGGRYSGISYTDKQFNRYCTEHFSYSEWLLRKYLRDII